MCQKAIQHFHDLSIYQAASIQGQTGSTGVQNHNVEHVSGGQTVGPYKNCFHYATGLFSTIYKHHHDGNEIWAIKITTPSTEQPPHNSRREARLLCLATHANVISLLETQQLLNGSFTLAFPFIPLTLERALSSTVQSLSISTVRDLFLALSHIHSQGILHRDIKPANILLSPSNTASNISEIRCTLCLADFGIAWTDHDPDSEPANDKITDIGTTCYRAPELLFGWRSYSTGVDLWSAGCVLAEIAMHNAWVHDRSPINGEWTLFDIGELGSELALVKSIFETLGTPDESVWPVRNISPILPPLSLACLLLKPAKLIYVTGMHRPS